MAWSFPDTGASGNRNFVRYANDPNSMPFPAAGWSVAFWLYIDSLAGSGTQAVYSYGAFNATGTFNISVQNASATDANKIRIVAQDNSGNTPNGTNQPGADGTDVTAGVWQHHCFTWDGASVRYYRDGVLDDTQTPTTFGQVSTGGTNLRFGARNPADTTNQLGGDIAELGKWDRTLSAGEVAGLGEGFSPVHYLRDLKFYIPMGPAEVELMQGLQPNTVADKTNAPHPPIAYAAPAHIHQVGPVSSGTTVTLNPETLTWAEPGLAISQQIDTTVTLNPEALTWAEPGLSVSYVPSAGTVVTLNPDTWSWVHPGLSIDGTEGERATRGSVSARERNVQARNRRLRAQQHRRQDDDEALAVIARFLRRRE